jgi:hypothetical protein
MSFDPFHQASFHSKTAGPHKKALDSEKKRRENDKISVLFCLPAISGI